MERKCAALKTMSTAGNMNDWWVEKQHKFKCSPLWKKNCMEFDRQGVSSTETLPSASIHLRLDSENFSEF
jgi:hypothetical protein